MLHLFLQFIIHKNSSIISAVVLPTTEIIESNYLSQVRTVFIILAFLYLRRKHAEGNTIVMLHRDFLSSPTNGDTKLIRNSKNITRKRLGDSSRREKSLVN